MQKRKLTEQQVAEIKELAQTTMKKVDIARKFGVSPQLISTIIRYGYDSRPFRPDKVKAKPAPGDTWQGLADAYNSLYRDEPAISAEEVKVMHDIALKKMLKYFTERSLDINDLL